MKSTLSGLFILTRPLNCGIAAVSVWVGGCTAGMRAPTAEILLAALSAALIMAAGNAFNDLRDIEIDRINRPLRPLPSGSVTARTTRIWAALLAASGLLIAWWIGVGTGQVASLALLLLLVYSLYLKATAFFGNLTVSLLGALTFPYGAMVAGSWGRSWIPALFALLLHLGREIVKDLEDVPGDRSSGAGTLPLRFGSERASLLAFVSLLLLMTLTLIPWTHDIYGTPYLIGLVPVHLALLVALRLLWCSRHGTSTGPVSTVLKLVMPFGLLAILAGELL